MKAFLAGLGLVAALAAPRVAEACGGFFCSQQPIDQSGERIVFFVSEDRVQAHVQIQYQGEAEQFAWVVPVHGLPEVSIGSERLFSYLEWPTRPRVELEWEETCGGWLFGAEATADGQAPPGRAGGDDGVTLVSRANVGPYDIATLTATDSDALTTWLRTNGYDIPDPAAEALAPYVGAEAGYHFVALRLQQDRGTGDLKPLVLDIPTNMPCIPLRLTAIAARPDMPITAFVFSEHRAVPLNYRHVLLNPVRLDWLGGGSNYTSVASAAVDEAGGQAFLTEFAGPHAPVYEPFGDLLPSTIDLGVLRTKTHPVDFVVELMRQQFPRDGLLELLTRHIPPPDGVEARDFFNRIETFRTQIDQDPQRPPFDVQAIVAELDETVVTPLTRADGQLATFPYLTRLFTTMSADEMTVDPEFAFNDSLGDVSNVFRAKARCEGTFEETVTVDLGAGRIFVAEWGQPITAGPAALRVEQLAAMGQPSVVRDNTEAIDRMLGVGCGCSAGEAPLAGRLLLALLGRRGLRSRLPRR